MTSFSSGWLVPLLDRVARNPTCVPSPLTSNIRDDTFAFETVKDDIYVGGFSWDVQVSFVY